MKGLRIFGYLVLLSSRSRFARPGVALTALLAQSLFYASSAFVIVVVVNRVVVIEEWSSGELGLLYGISLFSYGVAAAFGFGLLGLINSAKNTDVLLGWFIKPYDPLLLICGSNFLIAYVAHVAVASCVIGWALCSSQVVWTCSRAIYLILACGSSVCWQLGMFVVMAIASLSLKDGSWLPSVYSSLLRLTYFPPRLFGDYFFLASFSLVPTSFFVFMPSVFFFEKYGFSTNSLISYSFATSGFMFLTVAFIAWKWRIRSVIE